ncbi:MAG: KH domain-containing protein [Candidatus Neomarinimicrobiota bacterium]
MEQLIGDIVKDLVDKPDEVTVTPVESERTVIYELRVGDGDLGKVIGKHGRTAQAIRTIISAISAKGGGKRALLEIVE